MQESKMKVFFLFVFCFTLGRVERCGNCQLEAVFALAVVHVEDFAGDLAHGLSAQIHLEERGEDVDNGFSGGGNEETTL